MAKSEKLSISNEYGQILDARLDFPLNQDPKAYAIFAHCFTCNKNLTAVRNISKALVSQGIAVLRFDFTGLGRSEGEFADTNFTSNINDLKKVASYLAENFQAPQIMIGHSLGGTATLFAASEIDSVRAVCTIGSPSMPEHVTHLFSSVQTEIQEKGEAMLRIGMQDIKVKQQFIDDLKNRDIHEIVKRDKKSYLIIHSPQDQVVGIENAGELYAILKHPKSFVSLNGADHMMSNSEDSRYVGSLIAAWALRYLELPKQKNLETNHQVAVRLNKKDKFTSEVISGKHSLIADEPESVGGKDYGPSPYELVSAGLGACTAMTLQMYAARKNWDLEEVVVHVDYGKMHAKDCEECENETGQIDRFDRSLLLKGRLDEKQKQRLLEIADKCPVHKTLERGSIIETSMV